MAVNKFSTAPKPSVDRTDVYNDYGVYQFNDDNVTIVTQPDFDSTLEAIADQPANQTTILTPELAVLNDDELANFLLSSKYRNKFYKEIHSRFKRLKQATKDSNNTILMGSPTRSQGKNHNSLQVVAGGNIVQTQNKSAMGPYESSLQVFEEDKNPAIYHRLGATAIICSELIYARRLTDDIKSNTNKLLMSAAWGVPTTTPNALKRFDSLDDYNADNLNRSAAWAAKSLPNLESLYIADRPMGESKQQTGRLKIKRAPENQQL